MDTREKIDAYVKGRMSDAERAAFQSDMLKDPALTEAVHAARIDLQVANALVREQIAQWFVEWDAQHPANPARGKSRRRQAIRWGLAAAIWILLTALLIWQLRNRQPIPDARPAPVPEALPEPAKEALPGNIATFQADSQRKEAVPQLKVVYHVELAKAEFAYDTYQPLLRGEVPKIEEDTMQLALEAVGSGAMREAISFASRIAPDNPAYPDAQLLLGQLYFRKGQYSSAEQHLEAAINSGLIGRDQPEWNLLMACIAQHPLRQKKADQLLQRIAADPGHSYHNKAVALSGKLPRE